MKKYINGQEFDLTDEEIAEKNTQDKEENDRIAATRYISDRQASYPKIEDQLDAIWKQFEQDRIDGKTLEPSCNDILDSILTTKNTFPKP